MDKTCYNCRFIKKGECSLHDDYETKAFSSCRDWQGDNTTKGRIEKKALEILEDFPQIKDQPASISGKFHLGETIEQHLERTASIMRHLCDGMNIHGENRDMLIACAYLHDLGIYTITKKGEVDHPSWKYHEKSGWSRIDYLMPIHPVISTMILEKYHIPRKRDIQRIISTHMGYWYANDYNPRPKTLFEYLMVEADYLATRPQSLTEFTGENKK
jgi:hypothetical protein